MEGVPLTAGTKAAVPLPGKRRRLDIWTILLNLFLPWMLFCSVYATMSFSFHYSSPAGAWALVIIAALIPVMCVVMEVRSQRAGERGKAWWLAALLFGIAVILGTIMGDMNFWYNMQPFYDIENLNVYPSVNPAREKGQQLMDAGRVYFADGAHLDLNKAMAFKNLDLYCVAPIVNGENAQLDTYDFWAVGLNCCGAVSSDFRCGEYNNPHARSGLRLMRDDQRPFFRLAVQQAEAAYNIRSTHPLFFHWLQDPVAEVNAYRDDGFKFFLLGVFTHFAFSLFAVAAAVVGFSKM